MGKKKSVVFMILLTIVIVALCALTAFPAFTLPWNKVKSWNPAVLQYDLGADLGGGYYAYYYPEGVIPETEYKENVSALQDAVESAKKALENASADQKADKQKTLVEREKELNEYLQSYEVAHKGLRFNNDEQYGIISNGLIKADFKTEFNKMASEISERYKKKGYSDYRVAVVDDYAMRVELPKSEENATLSLSYFGYTGEMTLEKGGALIEQMEDGAKITDLIKSVSVSTRYDTAYLKVKFTKAGRAMIAGIKGELSDSTEASSSTDASTLTTLDIKIGDQVIASVYGDSITDNNREARILPVEEVYKDRVETVKILFDSAMENGGYDISLTTSDVRVFEPVYGEKALDLLYIALGIVLLALLVLPVIKMGRFGVVSGYATLSYLIVTGICFAFISGGVFEITLGSVLVFLAGLILVNALQLHIYGAIKKEFDLGKTVESSVKGGYKKTLWGVVDIYAVLLLGALALLVGAAGLHTVALQAIICVVTGAFINLLWARAINFTFLSASKNKYKYFRFVREDDDDE